MGPLGCVGAAQSMEGSPWSGTYGLVGIMSRDFHLQKQLKPKHANMHAAGPFTEQVSSTVLNLGRPQISLMEGSGARKMKWTGHVGIDTESKV